MQGYSARATPFAILVYAGATAVLYALAAPPVALWPLAWICGIPLLWSLRGHGPVERLVIGFCTGSLISLLTILVPLGSAFASYFEIPFWRGALGALAVGTVFGGGGFAVMALLAGDLFRGRPTLSVLRIGAAWVAGDLFRTIAFTGLPWLLLGQLLAPAPQLAQLAALGGTGLVSFWVACGNASLLLLAVSERRRVAAGSVGVLAAVGLAAILAAPNIDAGNPGAVRTVVPASPVRDGALRVALVQPAVPRPWRLDPAHSADALERLVSLTREAGPVDLAIWPENALPVLLPANRGFVREALGRLSTPPAHLLLGAPRFDSADPALVYNSAMIFDRDGHALGAHDKVHLVPFTEYTPASLGVLGFAGAGITEGDRPVVLSAGDAQLGPLICYEMLFPDISLALVRGGAEILVNLSNDGYFGGTGGAEQHLSAAVLRAIELRRPVLRSTSDGITVAIDATGRSRARLDDREPGVLAVDVWPGRARSPYAQIGDVVPWACLAFSTGFTALEWWRRRTAIPRSADAT